MKITTREKGILAIIRLNQLLPDKRLRRTWHIGQLSITFEWRSKNNLWGRFGGGWDWALGVEVGGSTILFNLLVFSVRITQERKC